MPAILIAESDRHTSALIRKGLFANGFSVRTVADGMSAYAYARSGNFDLMVVAAGLPGMDAIDMVRRLRAEGRSLPVVMLTAPTGVADTQAMSRAGIDDHLCRPLQFDELLACVHRRLKLGRSRQRPVLCYGGLRLDLHTRRAYIGDYFVDLSARECALAEMFLRHPGEVLTREDLRRQVWGAEYPGGSNVVDVYIRYLRGKLGAGWFVALRGIGYRLQAA